MWMGFSFERGICPICNFLGSFPYVYAVVFEPHLQEITRRHFCGVNVFPRVDVPQDLGQKFFRIFFAPFHCEIFLFSFASGWIFS